MGLDSLSDDRILGGVSLYSLAPLTLTWNGSQWLTDFYLVAWFSAIAIIFPLVGVME